MTIKPLKGISIHVSFKDGIFETNKQVSLFFNTIHPQKITDSIEGAMKEIKKHKGWNINAYVAVEAIDQEYNSHRYKVLKPYGGAECELNIYTREIGQQQGADQVLKFETEQKMYKALKNELDKAVKDLLCGQEIKYSDIYL